MVELLVLLREERKNVRRNNEPKHYAYVNVRVPRTNVNLNDQKRFQMRIRLSGGNSTQTESTNSFKGPYPISILEKKE